MPRKSENDSRRKSGGRKIGGDRFVKDLLSHTDNRAYQGLTRAARGTLADMRRFAGHTPETRGVIANIEDFMWRYRIDSGDAAFWAELDEIVAAGFVQRRADGAYVFPDWERTQLVRLSDAERKQNERARKRGDVTSMSPVSHQLPSKSQSPSPVERVDRSSLAARKRRSLRLVSDGGYIPAEERADPIKRIRYWELDAELDPSGDIFGEGGAA